MIVTEAKCWWEEQTDKMEGERSRDESRDRRQEPVDKTVEAIAFGNQKELRFSFRSSYRDTFERDGGTFSRLN
jgi:hypothetical protein